MLFLNYFQSVFIYGELLFILLFLYLWDNCLKNVIRTVQRPEDFRTKNCTINCFALIFRSITGGGHWVYILESFKKYKYSNITWLNFIPFKWVNSLLFKIFDITMLKFSAFLKSILNNSEGLIINLTAK